LASVSPVSALIDMPIELLDSCFLRAVTTISPTPAGSSAAGAAAGGAAGAVSSARAEAEEAASSSAATAQEFIHEACLTAFCIDTPHECRCAHLNAGPCLSEVICRGSTCYYFHLIFHVNMNAESGVGSIGKLIQLNYFWIFWPACCGCKIDNC
jgi:hypothetical protein